jgi:hypothetical protein
MRFCGLFGNSVQTIAVRIGFLSEDGLSLLDEHFGIPPESVWQGAAELIAHPPHHLFDLRMLSDFPEIFAEFRGKRFKILWRGGRDGFGSKEFHRRCDGHANTLIVILDTNGNIFGGFTPVEWESRVWNQKQGNEDNTMKVDDSLRSFLFTLKNLHNIPARRFPLKAENKHQAISCFSEGGPNFYDIVVYSDCNENAYNCTSLGITYINNTGLAGEIVFVGSVDFKVEDIEVFEITA